MNEPRPVSERRLTGIEGLDRILEGGFLVAGVYIVQGPPGAGKTILANQTCFNHAAAGGQVAVQVLVLLQQPVHRAAGDDRSFRISAQLRRRFHLIMG